MLLEKSQFVAGEWLLMLVLTGLAGCSVVPDDTSDAEAPDGFETASRSWQWFDRQSEPVVRIAGRLVYGHEVREFESCAGRSYWVSDATGGDLRQTYEASIGRAYQSRFVEVLAVRLPVPDAAFAASYDGQLRITELLRLETEGPGCSLDLGGAQARASGVEPFWHLDVDAGALRLSRMGQPSRTFTISAIESDASSRIWRTEAGNDTLTLTIRKARCADTMSGSLFAYEAQIRLADEMLFGCALRPLPTDPD